jgi:protein TonB
VPQRDAPVRVGSSIRNPQKIYDVLAVYPESARQAGITGVVLVELTVGMDGRVTAAKVLRGAQPLHQAALDAARQWRYEPELLNGKPVPFIGTAPVAFKP